MVKGSERKEEREGSAKRKSSDPLGEETGSKRGGVGHSRTRTFDETSVEVVEGS